MTYFLICLYPLHWIETWLHSQVGRKCESTLDRSVIANTEGSKWISLTLLIYQLKSDLLSKHCISIHQSISNPRALCRMVTFIKQPIICKIWNRFDISTHTLKLDFWIFPSLTPLSEYSCSKWDYHGIYWQLRCWICL